MERAPAVKADPFRNVRRDILKDFASMLPGTISSDSAAEHAATRTISGCPLVYPVILLP